MAGAGKNGGWMMDKPILLSAGGTGGHLFPAEALAAAFEKRGRKIVVVTDKRGQAFRTLGKDTPVHTVRAATLKSGLLSKIRAVFEMGVGIVQSLALLQKYKPAIIVGFGGYPSFPAVFAGQLCGIPTILHEQNAVMGKANAFLAKRASAVAASHENTRGLPATTEAVVTGNPVRDSIVALRDYPYAFPEAGKINILITGGSQGASIFSSIVPEAIVLLPEALKDRFNVSQQCREADLTSALAIYHKGGVSAEVAPFFSDMAGLLKDCHVFIGRSGATTVAETAVAGRPAIFVPLRHVDDQQALNAATLAQTKGAWIIPQDSFTPQVLAQKLEELLTNPAMLTASAAAAKACGRPHAAEKLADFVESRIKI